MTISAENFAEGQGEIELTLEWRYHPGDDPQWADPALNDAGWEPALPLLPADGLPRSGWPGTGWFRRHLRVDRALWGRPLTIRVATPGATTVFLDGQPLVRAGSPGGAWHVTAFTARRDHVLAVRHTSTAGRSQAAGLGFRLSIETPDAPAVQLANARFKTTLLAVFTSVPAFLALLHLALFFSYPKARENLFYVCFLVAFASVMISDRLFESRFTIPLLIGMLFFGLLTYYAVRIRPFPRTWMVFAAVGGLFIAASMFRYARWHWYVYFGLVTLEVIRMELIGGRRKVTREAAGILLAGWIVAVAVATLQIFIELGVIPPLPGWDKGLQYSGVLAVAVSMSLFLARSFARTSLHLERRLDEVRTLSGQVLAQERTAHEHELHQQLLEAENARKTAEIEAARALQLSMLPTALPQIEGLETAALMTTASEVGGDYYDFRLAPDGSLLVAFGDATGHGVAAGIMVTAIKALFSAREGGEGLTEMLTECDRVLRGMHLKPLHMCLTLARVTARSIAVCSAAMPPVLIHRAGTGEVEELGAGGLPVGSRLAGCWQERSAALFPGDTALFASDGFAEALDPAGDSLGYEAAVEAFRAAAGAPARELIDRLLACVAAWRGNREQADDVTFVVVRVGGRRESPAP